MATMMRGKIYLMAAAAGDSSVLTPEAANLLRAAEVVLHDGNVAPQILDLIPASAQVRNVEKIGERQGNSQEKTNALLIASAREGRLVVRVKIADPLLPGHFSEELEGLAHADVDFEIIQGAKSALTAVAGRIS
jgi:uroporphyrin-III C-methyltransferase/precorrin-2 dehydrogenase/sirohydrochlorin ferrochelatase